MQIVNVQAASNGGKSSKSERLLTEWELQGVLTEEWATPGLTIADERLFLAAWEVMDDWEVNDAQSHWAHPSIDFLFLDVAGRLVATELKRRVRQPREAWSVLCQVTHRAHGLAASCNLEQLEHVYKECRGGRFGRVPRCEPAPIAEAHQLFFQRKGPVEQLGAGDARRVVLALDFAECWEPILARFNETTLNETVDYVNLQYRVGATANREMARLISLRDAPLLVYGPVQHRLVFG